MKEPIYCDKKKIDEIKFLVGSDFLHTGTAKKLELDTVDIEKVEIMRFIDEGSN